MRLGFVTILTLASFTVGCRKVDTTSKSKSLVGLEAELDASVLRGEAPSFLYLQQWFKSELPVDVSKAQVGEVPYKVHSSFTQNSFNALPTEYRNKLIAYFKQQQVRVAEFQANLGNAAKLNQLLQLEANEMADILKALIDPGYVPQTQDLLARMIAHKPLRSFVDRYSVGILEKLYARSQRSLLLGMDTERDNFAKILIKTYVTTNGATPQFIAALESDCAKIQDLLTALRSGGDSICRAQAGANLAGISSVDVAARAVGGTSGQVLGMFGGITAADGFAARGSLSPKLGIFKGRDPNANDPYANGSATPVPGTTNNPTPANNGGTNNTTPPVINNDNGGQNNNGDGSNNDLLSLLISLFSGASSGSGGNLTDIAEASSAQSFDLIPAPKGQCSGKSGLELVICQRYIETLRPTTRLVGTGEEAVQLELADSNSTSNAVGYNFFMISKYATKVQNQGSEGACTAFGLAHTLGILGKAHGKSGEYDAWNIWRAQGQQPMTTAAIAAAKRMNFDGMKIASARSINPSIATIKRILDSGRPVYFASDVDGSWNGAGRGNANITCRGSTGMAHAYTLVGYDDAAQKLVIKNSWGDYWGDQGYGYLSYNCIGRMNDYGHDVQVQ